jgi:hypothetical protein
MYKDFEDAELDRGQSLNIEWVPNPSNMAKADRISGGLEKLWNQQRIYLKPGNENLAAAFLEFPRPPEWDRLDSFCTGRLAGMRPVAPKEKTTLTKMQEHIDSIKKGTGLIWPDGERADAGPRRTRRRPPRH